MHQMSVSTLNVSSVMLEAKVFENSKSYRSVEDLIHSKLYVKLHVR